MAEQFYRLKPLDWQCVRQDDECTTYHASTVLGLIVVDYDAAGAECHWRYCFDEFYDEDSHSCESIDDGKAKAEEFYLNRILPAVEAVVQEPK